MVIENIIKYLIFIVSTCLTYFLGKMSKKHKWNETLPIPVQNCIVGVVVFILAYAFCVLMKLEISSDIIITQIILTMGGSGFATLVYDAKKK